VTERLFDPPADPRPRPWREIAIAVGAVLAVFAAWLSVAEPVVPIALAFGLIFLIFAFRWPFVPCILFIIFSFLRIPEVFPVLLNLKIPLLLAVLTIAVIGWHLFFLRTMKVFWTRELKIFALFFFFCTVSVVFAKSKDLAFTFWADVFVKIGLMTFVVAWATRKPEDFSLISRSFCVFGSVVAMVAIYNWMNGIGLVEGSRVTIGRNIRSLLGDPNDLALALLFPFSFAAALLMGRCGWADRLLGAVACGTIFWGIMCTQSRGGLLGLAAVAAVIGSRFVKSKLVLIGGGLVCLFILFAAAGISGRSSGGASEGAIVDESSEGRLTAWRAATSMAIHNPLTGVGIANFTANYFEYSDTWDGKPHAVHSTWFGILGEIGVPGFVTLMVLVTCMWRMCLHSLKAAQAPEVDPRLKMSAVALLAGLASFCVSGTFLTQGTTWPLYVILALSVALDRALAPPDAEGEADFLPPPRPAPRAAFPRAHAPAPPGQGERGEQGERGGHGS
jgi:O-antigen ligase